MADSTNRRPSPGRLTVEWNEEPRRPVLVRHLGSGTRVGEEEPLIVLVDDTGIRSDPESAAEARVAVDGWVVEVAAEEHTSFYVEREPDPFQVPRLDIEGCDGVRRTVRIELEEGGRLVVGRGGAGRECDLVIEDARMSGVHFEIELRRGDLQLRDLESRHGTVVNGNPVRASHRLRHLDEIRVGRTRMILRNPSDELQAETIVSIPEASSPPSPLPEPVSRPAEAMSSPTEPKRGPWAKLSMLAVVLLAGFLVFLFGVLMLILAVRPGMLGLERMVQS